MPGYDLRRVLMAQDPLAAVLAFGVQVRSVLAPAFGIRMCPDCPHCAESPEPCQDAFGSNAEAMGGFGGRSDGMAGAVECQKSSGSLHIHLWNFIQRAHQHHTLAEIAAAIEAALLSAADLKRFCATLCCEAYPDEDAVAKAIGAVEARWPKFHERDGAEAGAPVTWGAQRFGRLPAWLWSDDGASYGDLYAASPRQRSRTLQELQADAEVYAGRFNAALQENQLCAQHHIHKRDPKTGERKIPNACQSFRCAKTCKHEFPQDARMNRGEPLLVCKGIARKRGLKLTGTRNVYGQMLGTRNNPWLDGTAPGLCVALSGGNSDVKLNDRLPIMHETHEAAHCTRRCVPGTSAQRKRALRRMVRRTQTAQAQTNGYFGGYIGKRQKSGKLETRKCVDKMYVLRAKTELKSASQQQRAATGRMVTDIEMNSTIRGAVEEFNLCVNLRANDVLFAECIRTFATVTVNAQAWLHRLELELQSRAELAAAVAVPPTRRPNKRSLRSKAPWVDLYGFRPLDGTPFSLLAPYEFLRYWQGEALTPPRRDDPAARTRWTEAGEALLADPRYHEGKLKATAGVHYVVVEPATDAEYITYPAAPAHVFQELRHTWVLTRRPRPYVPILEGVPVPSPTRTAEENARYMSVLFRPWTLYAARPHAPLLRDLGVAPGEGSPPAPAPEPPAECSFARAWRSYIQGNVVSQHAARLISSMLTKTLARSSEFAPDEQADEEDKTDLDEDIPPLKVGAAAARSLFRATGGEPSEDAEGEPKRKRGRADHGAALALAKRLWWQPCDLAGATLAECGPMHAGAVQGHIAARAAPEDAEEKRPYSARTVPRAETYGHVSAASMHRWLQSLQAGKEPPTEEQARFLREVIERIELEARAEQEGRAPADGDCPLFDVIHGVPGAGKSKLIGWLRELFEQELHWTHGVEFVCLAFQNAMAAAIDGYTVHHWTGLPVGDADGTATTRDNNKFSAKCQRLRFILVDEISMISAQLLAQLEILVARVIRRRSPYKVRVDGTHRPFGGVNTMLFGDWWQLKPVTGTALFSNPAEPPTFAAFHGLRLLWGPPPHAVRRCWNFERSLRCADPWYNLFLAQCRNGSLTAEAHHLLHGYPTAAPVRLSDRAFGVAAAAGSPPCTCAADTAQHDRSAGPAAAADAGPAFYGPWVVRFLGEGASAAELVRSECAACADLRRRRARVLGRGVDPSTFVHQRPFDAAPALYAYNVPRYCAVMIRAAAFALARDRRLHWCVARDTPLHRDDRDLPLEELDAKRQRWLLRHDQETMHVASSVPLVQGLPVRLTDSLDRGRFLFRGRRGTIHGWAPHPDETREDIDGVLLLSHLPRAIYVHFQGATFQIADLPVGVYPVTPRSRTWQVNKRTKVKVRRTGFVLVPDFASTAHMIQGQSLEAAFADVVHQSALELATEEMHVIAYVMLSRARFLERLWVMQAFGQQLFGRGPPVGPHLLLRKLLGELEAKDVPDAFVRAEAERGDPVDKDPMKRTYRCTACFLGTRRDCEKPPQSFGAFSPAEILTKIVEDGAWTRCLPCREIANGKRRARGAGQLPDRTGAEEAPPDAGASRRCEQCGVDRPLAYFTREQLHHVPRSSSRGTGLRCAVCRGIQHCEQCGAWKAVCEFRKAQAVCAACQPVVCSHCGPRPPADFHPTAKKNFFRAPPQNVQCRACTLAGRRPQDGAHRETPRQPCDRCGASLPVDSFRRSKRVRSQTCRDCEEIPCSACGRQKSAAQFDEQSAHHFFSHGQRALCSACHARGCTVRSPKLYTCVGLGACMQDFGAGRFNAERLRSFTQGRAEHLLCTACDARARAKDARLLKLWRTSKKQACKCGQPIHKEGCFLQWHGIGPRPYCGQDVLSRQEYDWLRRRQRIRA